jgi:predicted ATPase
MVDYTTDIRDGLKTSLRERVREQKIAKYLLSIKFDRIRYLRDQKINFDYPITAVIGPNGGGKSTVIGAAACAYLQIKPSLFFAKSHVGDEAMQDWKAEYEIIDKAEKPEGFFTRTAKFHNRKWVRESAPKRDVRYFGISRTVPASEKTIFQRISKKGFSPQGGLALISSNVAEKTALILGRPVERYMVGNITDRQQFYVGQNDIGQFSELHFGAGEASVLRMVSDLEDLENASLVLIEELENGLHPVAAAKMIEYLFDLSDRKKIQIIFTTHSDITTDALPREAVWASVDGRLQQGKLSVEATRAISGRVDRAVSIFVEDEFAKLWVEMILLRHLREDARQVGVYAVSGDSAAIKVHQSHMNNPAVETSSFCVLDGDSEQDISQVEFAFKLPGDQPENYLYNFALERIETGAAMLCAMCHYDVARQGDFTKCIAAVPTNTADPHLYFNKLGISLGFIAEQVIKRAFITFWLDNNVDIAASIVEPIKEKLKNL